MHIGNGSKPADWEQLNQIEIENELNWICDSRQYACKATFDNTQNIFYGMTQVGERSTLYFVFVLIDNLILITKEFDLDSLI